MPEEQRGGEVKQNCGGGNYQHAGGMRYCYTSLYVFGTSIGVTIHQVYKRQAGDERPPSLQAIARTDHCKRLEVTESYEHKAFRKVY
jgi:hypothetical protein